MGIQRIQAFFPKLPILFYPLLCFAQRTRLDPAVVLAAFDFAAEQTGTFKHHDVFGDCIQSHRERGGDLLNRRRTTRKLL
jgi:hypothetical protein